MAEASFGTPRYGITKNLGAIDFTEARTKTEAALKENGFGVLTEIDVAKTLKTKIDVDMDSYLILGACNPKLAHHAISNEMAIGLLLPCNVILAKDKTGDVMVSAVEPVVMFDVVQRPEMEPVAQEVKSLLQKAIDSL
ncbi:MAG: DUF302 domain-containing protein [Bdellovibrionaceae bacterium]|jgi:uncharacterized protein (DUF302 family)|nr:DUF302 domain-containing protein [Pseudobdellovibrionaceae bacterium]